MDTNYIKKDGFSNPDTEGFFKKHWNEDLMEATCRARKHCGVCFCAFIFVDSVEDKMVPIWGSTMHANRIKSDGFSNPGAQRYFAENWSDDRFSKESEERKCCGFCRYGHYLECEDYP
jgi:hypothetical protein